MPRSLVIGNGNVLVGFDANYDVRDIFFPFVGAENHTVGNVCRTGFWVDGRFRWLSDTGWKRRLGYDGDTLVTDVQLHHPELGLHVAASDYVDMVRDIVVRTFRVTVDQPAAAVRVFFHYDWYIRESDIGCTALYDPGHGAVVAYKDDRYFLLGGAVGDVAGITSWATGKKGESLQGTWVDAEDGELGRNPIDQGSVDCTVMFELAGLAPATPRELSHWICLGRRFEEVSRFGQDLLLARGEGNYRTRTQAYWSVWSQKDHRHIDAALGEDLRQLYRRSVLTIRTQVDNRGGIIAANDYDITKFARDTYSYMWPRDGALVANALDRADHQDITRQFFTFCTGLLGEEGYFLHKYNPDGRPGSSWHPWVDAAGERVLPIQEDETGLVLWALWEHFRMHGNLDYAMQLYSSLVVPAGQWMATYFDERNGCIKPSWDLWEERWGVHAFTVGAVWGGLNAARNFAHLFGDAALEEVFESARDRVRVMADTHLYRPELGRFARRLTIASDGSVQPDAVLDSAVHGLWRFGMYPVDHPQMVATMAQVADVLRVRSATGGQARYMNDYYFQVEHDLALAPGNPWFICTLWLAQWQIATARTLEDLETPQQTLQWVGRHRSEAGLLSEQLDPNTGAPLSVSPLTWSHAELLVTIDDYCRRRSQLSHEQVAEVHPA